MLVILFATFLAATIFKLMQQYVTCPVKNYYGGLGKLVLNQLPQIMLVISSDKQVISHNLQQCNSMR